MKNWIIGALLIQATVVISSVGAYFLRLGWGIEESGAIGGAIMTYGICTFFHIVGTMFCRKW